MGWRYLLIILGCMTLAVFFLRFVVFTFQESPKFLLSRGRDAEAIEVLHKIAKFNKAPAPVLTVEHLMAVDEMSSLSTAELETAGTPQSTAQTTRRVFKNFGANFKHLKALFTNKLQMFIFILLAIAYMGDYWSFNLAGSFLPIILLRNEVDSGTGTVTETYRHYIYIYLPGIVGAVLAMASVQLPIVGRKWSLVFSAICQGLAMAMYTQVYTTAGYVGLNAFEYIMQTVSSRLWSPFLTFHLSIPSQYFNAVLYASAPELFDTAYRGSASGMLSCLGRLAGIVAPFAGASYLASNSSGILWLGAGGIWLSALMMVFLPVEMRNRQMF